MKRNAPTHPKVYTLAALLNIPRWGAVGLLESLWHFAQGYAQSGDVGKHTDEAIARALGWEDNPATLVSAFAAAGWLDRCQCHRLRIHDWPEHADQTVERWLKGKNLSFLTCYGDASTILENSSTMLGSNYPAVPSRAVPCLAKPKPKPSGTAPPAAIVPTLAASLSWSHEASDEWQAVHGLGSKIPGPMFVALKGLLPPKGAFPWTRVRPVLRHYLRTRELDFLSWPKFQSGFQTIEAEMLSPGRASPKALAIQAAANAFITGGMGDQRKRLDAGKQAPGGEPAGPGPDPGDAGPSG